jgi:hypothetical protein
MSETSSAPPEVWDQLETETGETIYKRRGHSTGTDDKNFSKGATK